MIVKRGAPRGVTLIEALVVIAVGVIVLGLILTAMVESGRQSDDLLIRQQMRQEALVISQTIEKAIRFRVRPEYLAPSASLPPGGAAPTPAAGGVAAPPSVRDLLSTSTATAGASPATTSPKTNGKADPSSSAPESIRNLLKDPNHASPPAARQSSDSLEKMDDRRSLRIATLAFGKDPKRLLCGFRQVLIGPKSGVEMVLSPASATAAWTDVRKLGMFADRLNSTVDFRYGSPSPNLDVTWRESANPDTRLVEISVKVWPVTKSAVAFDQSVDNAGRPLRFEYRTVVSLP